MNFKFYSVMMFLVLGFYLCFYCCCSGPGPQTVDDVEDCDAACQHLLHLGCDAAQGSPGEDELWNTNDDIPCLTVCRGIVGQGGTLRLVCTIEAQTCAAVDLCFE